MCSDVFANVTVRLCAFAPLRLNTFRSFQDNFSNEFVKRANHSHAVFDLRIIAVMPARRNFHSGFDVNFIAEKSECYAESFAKFFLQFFNFLDRPAAKFGCHAR